MLVKGIIEPLFEHEYYYLLVLDNDNETFKFLLKKSNNEDKSFNINLEDAIEDKEFKFNNETADAFASIIGDPWSQEYEKYEIKVNCSDSYTEIPEGIPTWRCEYSILGYEGMYCSIFGYGFTEEEALKDCKNFYKSFRDKYLIEKDSEDD